MTQASALRPSVCLAFDFGEVRIGLAVGNSLTASAQSLGIIEAQDNATRFSRIADLISEWQPDALVVGVPRHPDGAAHGMTLRCEKFARQLDGRFGIPVFCVDERYTSVEASSRVNRKRVDDVAACIILEQFFLQQSSPT